MAASDLIAVLHQLAVCWERGDADGAAALFGADATYSEPPAPPLLGRAAIHAYFADFAARHHAVKFSLLRTLADPACDLLAAEWRFTHTRTADGARKVYQGMSWIEFANGTVTRWHGYSARLE
jgi:ketosteroid isomerase-like protein